MAILRGILAPVCLTVVAAILIYAVAGVSLNLFLAPLPFIAIIAPPLLLRTSKAGQALVIGATILLVFAGMLFIPVAQHVVSVWTWIQCLLTLGTFLGMTSAAAWVLRRLGVHEILTSAMATMSILAWLIWPVWGSAWTSVRLVNALITVHPLFAINSACRDFGIWTEQPVAYQLTTLGQDFPYQLPSTVWPCVLMQLFITALLISFTIIAQNSRRKPVQ